MTRDPDCIFCKIVAGEVPAHTVLDTPQLLGFLDVGPLADGHLLIIPKIHAERLTDLEPDVAQAIGKVLPSAGRALTSVTGCADFNVLQNNGKPAGQVVKHVHFHLIPRVEGDGLGYRWNAGSYPEGRAEALAQSYCDALADA